jgi:hypothetical protein
LWQWAAAQEDDGRSLATSKEHSKVVLTRSCSCLHWKRLYWWHSIAWCWVQVDVPAF